MREIITGVGLVLSIILLFLVLTVVFIFYIPWREAALEEKIRNEEMKMKTLGEAIVGFVSFGNQLSALQDENHFLVGHKLTTPVSYISRIYACTDNRIETIFPSQSSFSKLAPKQTEDEFSNEARFRLYYLGPSFILVSNGPDRKPDINSNTVLAHKSLKESSAIVNQLYDPTNGLNSPGDLFWDLRHPDYRRFYYANWPSARIQ